MAKKKKTVFVCQDCGYEVPKWLGKCPGCGAWNTMVEEVVAPEVGGTSSGGGLRLGLSDAQKPQPIGEVAIEDLPRFATGSEELDRVLGGGVIPGSMVLIVGDPGVGKSSLTLRVCADVARAGFEAVLPLRRGTGPTLFCFHPASGFAWQFSVLTTEIIAYAIFSIMSRKTFSLSGPVWLSQNCLKE